MDTTKGPLNWGTELATGIRTMQKTDCASRITSAFRKHITNRSIEVTKPCFVVNSRNVDRADAGCDTASTVPVDLSKHADGDVRAVTQLQNSREFP